VEILLKGRGLIFCCCLGYGRREAVEILLNAGANVHARDDGGLIPLHNACSFGHAEVCKSTFYADVYPAFFFLSMDRSGSMLNKFSVLNN
jgi:ankyrin repeat protein